MFTKGFKKTAMSKANRKMIAAGLGITGGLVAAPALVGAGLGRIHHKITKQKGDKDTSTTKGAATGALLGLAPAGLYGTLLASKIPGMLGGR